MLRPLLVGDGVALVFEDPADLPALLQDEGKLSQILRNLISNAIKFTERGEVRIWASYDAKTAMPSPSPCATPASASPRKISKSSFRNSAQVANPMQRRVKGTGLGLPLSRKLAELLGGSLSVQSAPGEGSVFSVTVPRRCRGFADLAERTEDWQVQAGQVPILVVEDDPADAFAVERILAPSRYQAIIAHTVAEARRALEQVRPAAIMLDVVLLGDESWRLLIELRQRDATAGIPVLVVSAAGEERKAISLGADEYLEKPIDPAQLIRLLDQVSGHHSVTRVLLVDDEEVSRYLVRQLLPRGIYDIKEAATGVDGLARLERRTARYHTARSQHAGDGRLPVPRAIRRSRRRAGDHPDLDDPRRRRRAAARPGGKDRLQIGSVGGGADGRDRRHPVRRRKACAMTAGAACSRGAARILVVDDDAGGRYFKTHILARSGYAVDEAELGHAAIEQIAAAPPDLVLLDVKLPDIDGNEVCRRIKAAFPQIAVLQTSSAMVSAQDRAAALDCGADSYLIEPIEPDELVAVVKALLRMRKAEQELRRAERDP